MADPSKPEGQPRLLVLRPGAIGDTLLALPALLALRQRYPEHHVTLVGNAWAVPFVTAVGAVDECALFDGAAVTRLFVPSAPALNDPFNGIDVAVAWCADPDGVLTSGLRVRGAQSVVVAPSRPPADRPDHVARHLVSTLAPLGIPDVVPDVPRLILPPDAQRAAHNLLAPHGLDCRSFVVVHPGSGSAAKNWPPERFADVIRQSYAERSIEAVVLAGPADEAAIQRLLARLDARPIVLRDLPLTVAGAVMRRAAAFLGNDSGFSHLAGLLGCRTLTLFGPTDPGLWKPLGPHVRTIRRQPLAAVTSDEVLAALLSPS
ncbi:MAG: glycosyltransferase family 9 protein [Chloroflexi bacterium]|nr:glycosyltransferase family 9 protein [Chloroflexota bacterium]